MTMLRQNARLLLALTTMGHVMTCPVMTAEGDPVADSERVPTHNYALPPELASWTEAEKMNQRAAARALITELKQQIDSGVKVINVPQGHYRFDEETTDGVREGCSITLENLRNVILDGQGSTFWITNPKLTVLGIEQCDGLTVKNLTIDYDPLPYVQGRVTAITTEAPVVVDFKVDPGFEEAMEVFQSIPKARFARVHFFKDDAAQTFPYSPTWHAGHDGGGKIHFDPESRMARFTLSVRGDSYEVVSGDLIALTPRYNDHGVVIKRCGAITLEDVTVYASARMGLYVEHAEGVTRLDRFRLIRRPETRRLVSSCLDGLHFKYCKVGPHIVDSEVEASMDDAIAIPSMNAVILEQASSTEILAASRHKSVPINMKPGSSVRFYDPANDRLIGSSVVKEIIRDAGGPRTFPAAKVVGKASVIPFRVKLTDPLTLKPGLTIVSDRWRGDGYIIMKSRISNNWAHAIRATGTGGLVEACEFDNTGGLAFSMNNPWLIGSATEGLIFQNNKVNNIRSENAMQLLSKREGQTFYRDIEITGNRFTNLPGAALHIMNTTPLTISNNVFERTNLGPAMDAGNESGPVVLENCPETTLHDNRFEALGPSATEHVVIVK